VNAPVQCTHSLDMAQEIIDAGRFGEAF